MNTDAAVPCSSSFSSFDASELKDFIGTGASGVADLGATDFIYAELAADGSVRTRHVGSGLTDFDLRVPPAMFSDMKPPVLASIEINNSELTLLTLKKPPNWHVILFRKSDSTWHQLPDFYLARAFGLILACSESHAKNDTALASAGKNEWRSAESLTGPSIASRLDHSALVYPGVLHIYDVGTGKSFKITTSQADSEVLLIENRVIYYRVSNRLYSASFTETTVGQPKLLATDDLIRDAHWAFTKH